CGSALAASGDNWKVIIWAEPSQQHWWLGKGLLWKVIVPMVTSPLAGLVLGFVIMAALYALLQNARPTAVSRFFGRAQMVSAGAMGFMHGTNDAQKTMGIIALTLFAATKAGHLDHPPEWLSFLRTTHDPGSAGIALWIKITCALIMAAGPPTGGWGILPTLGHKMVKVQPVNGPAPPTRSCLVIPAGPPLGVAVST